MNVDNFYIQMVLKSVQEQEQQDGGPMVRLFGNHFRFNPTGYNRKFERWFHLLTKIGVQVCSFRQYLFGPDLTSSKVTRLILILIINWALVVRDVLLLVVDHDVYLEMFGDYLRFFGEHRKLVQMALAGVNLNGSFFLTMNWIQMLRKKAVYISYLMPFCDQNVNISEKGTRLSLRMQQRFQMLIELYIQVYYTSTIALISMFWTTNLYFLYTQLPVTWCLTMVRLIWLIVNSFFKAITVANAFWTTATYFLSCALQNLRLQLLFRLFVKTAHAPDQRLTLKRARLLLNELQVNVKRMDHLARSFNEMMGEAFYTISLYNNVVNSDQYNQ